LFWTYLMPPADNHLPAAFLFFGEVQGSLHVHFLEIGQADGGS